MFVRLLVIQICFLLSLPFIDLGIRHTEADRQTPEEHVRISYSLQIKPLLMLHCAGCHGPDNWYEFGPYVSDFDVTTYEGLIKGGADQRRGFRPDILPGFPERSQLQQYIESGKMPYHSEKLQPTELQLLSTWIKEGAKEDLNEVPSVHVVLEDVPLITREGATNYPSESIVCHIPVESYATIIITDPKTGIVRKSTGAILKVAKNGQLVPGSAASTDGWLVWSLPQELRGFDIYPKVVSIELVIQSFKEMPWGAEFGVTRVLPEDRSWKVTRPNSGFLPQPISLSTNHQGHFHYLLDGDADVDIGIVNIDKQRTPPIYADHQSDLKAGEKTYPWNLKDNQGKTVAAGGYVARFRSRTRNTNIPVNDICVVFQLLP